MPYGDINLVNIVSGNGLLPDGTKALPEPMLTWRQEGSTCQMETMCHTGMTALFPTRGELR